MAHPTPCLNHFLSLGETLYRLIDKAIAPPAPSYMACIAIVTLELDLGFGRKGHQQHSNEGHSQAPYGGQVALTKESRGVKASRKLRTWLTTLGSPPFSLPGAGEPAQL